MEPKLEIRTELDEIMDLSLLENGIRAPQTKVKPALEVGLRLEVISEFEVWLMVKFEQ